MTPQGRRHAAQVAAGLWHEPLAEVHSSPLERARQTAALVGDATGAPVTVVPALDEVDFGAWSGTAFSDLDDDPRWHDWNARRASACPPGGEAMADAQARIVDHVCATARRRPGATVAMVTHCDMIRAVLCAASGHSLDAIHDFEAAPCSVHRLTCDDSGIRPVAAGEAVA